MPSTSAAASIAPVSMGPATTTAIRTPFSDLARGRTTRLLLLLPLRQLMHSHCSHHQITAARRRAASSVVSDALHVIVLGSLGTYAYFVYQGRHPPDQLPQDPSKKTIVVLEAAVGSTSLLKNIDTEEYNVVVISPHNYFLFTTSFALGDGRYPLMAALSFSLLDTPPVSRHARSSERR